MKCGDAVMRTVVAAFEGDRVGERTSRVSKEAVAANDRKVRRGRAGQSDMAVASSADAREREKRCTGDDR